MQLPQYRIHACVTGVVRSLFGVLGFDGLDDQLGHGYPGLDAVPAQVLVQAFGRRMEVALMGSVAAWAWAA